MIRLKTLAAAVTLLLASHTSFAQGEAANWYFGKNAGITFKAGKAHALTNGRLMTEEGSATISDAQGNLLFSTDGITVWNRNNRVMPNGNGLMGMKSSTQSALILPKPGADSTYYIFTTDIQAQGNGLRYNVVDLTKEKGLGDIVSKNIFMIAPSTEKLTAVRHQNGRDWWVIAHRWNSDAYISYLVSDEGVSVQPVISNVGSVHGGMNRKAIGYLVPSPDGRRLAAALFDDNGSFELLWFNRATGIISDPIVLQGYEEAYGVAFSPDGSKLYGTTNGKGGNKAQIIQFDVAGGSAQEIKASSEVIAQSGSPRIGAMQLGPDGRIYVARKDNVHLGVISFPNAKGKACTYNDDGFHLGGRKSDLGLPNFPQGLTQVAIRATTER